MNHTLSPGTLRYGRIQTSSGKKRRRNYNKNDSETSLFTYTVQRETERRRSARKIVRTKPKGQKRSLIINIRKSAITILSSKIDLIFEKRKLPLKKSCFNTILALNERISLLDEYAVKLRRLKQKRMIVRLLMGNHNRFKIAKNFMVITKYCFLDARDRRLRECKRFSP